MPREAGQCDPHSGEESSTGTGSEQAQRLRVADGYFKAAIKNICKELKGNMMTMTPPKTY